MWVWRQRYAELGARADVQYVLIFENRGVEVGVTLHHPHGQIYAYPFLPPVPAAELAADERLGGCAPCELLARELRDGRRVVYENEDVVVYVPYAARWAYEAHVVVRAHRRSLLECEPGELDSLAEGLQALMRGYDALFDRPFPYVMAVHQAPTGGGGNDDRRQGSGGHPAGRPGTCTSSSTRRCAPRTSSSTSRAPSRARARSSPTRCPRSPRRRCARRSPMQRSPDEQSSPEERGRAGASARALTPSESTNISGGLPAHVRAFAPGRVCLIGEHTDYNDGLALAFAIAEGVTRRRAADRARAGRRGSARTGARARPRTKRRVRARRSPARARAGARSCAARWPSCGAPGLRPVGASLRIQGDVPRGSGLSSSAALEVALSLALLALAGTSAEIDTTELAKLCSRVENEWAGAQTGLLDQLTLAVRRAGHGAEDRLSDAAHSIRFRWSWTAGGWSRSTRGERRATRARATTSAAPNARGRASCWACSSLREASWATLEQLPPPLRERARHVLSDNTRVDGAVAALRAGDLPALARLLNESHASLRDDLEVSTPAVEATVRRMLDAGAAGARLLGGGFGGSVLGLLGPGVPAPAGGLEVRPCGGARVLEG